MLVISVVGELSSGKSTITRLFAEKLNCEIIEIGALVKRFTQSDDRATLQAELNKHKNEFDWLYNELAKDLNEKIDKGFKVTIVSGIREPILLCKMMEECEVINIVVEANDFVRYKRLIERDGFVSLRDFRMASKKDMDLGLDITMSLSDYTIDSTQSLDVIERCVEQILLNCGQILMYYKND